MYHDNQSEYIHCSRNINATVCTSSLVVDGVPILQACNEVFGPLLSQTGSKYCNKRSKYLDGRIWTKYFEVYEPGVQILRDRPNVF